MFNGGSEDKWGQSFYETIFQKVPKVSENKQTNKQTQFKTSDDPIRVKQIVMSTI